MRYILMIGILCSVLSCAYKPVIDTGGQSKFPKSNAKQLTDDLQHCEKLAKENSSVIGEVNTLVFNYYWRSIAFYLTPKQKSRYQELYKNCLKGRNHNVID